ncbi:MAG: endonuclease [Frankiales bacterium]|nr:endonuclease [Frankiales bacterium]
MNPRISALIARLVYSPSGCLLWPGAVESGGYGHAWIDGRTPVVHRAIYEAVVGVVPAELDLDHLCRVRRCCNWLHLEPVTRRENLRRGSHHLRDRSTCKAGHALTGANVSPSDGTRRRCLTCQRAAVARYRARKLTACSPS